MDPRKALGLFVVVDVAEIPGCYLPYPPLGGTRKRRAALRLRHDDNELACSDPSLRHRHPGLPLAVRVALVQGLQVTSTEQLLSLPDALIRTALTNAVGCGRRGVADFDRWLSEQRGGRGEPVQQQVHARAQADALLGKVRDDIGAAIRTVIERDDLAAADVARRCGTTQMPWRK